ncbi:hypothetical protein GUJ93_ZPchr0004g38880 [Zizania palustris]|uniref:Uncharacterized protein n=1 Tax=Zizania palustris TaxID=103762 RepID=A0A8J5V907_ZIZPA|nr:hypothetical protein GUJ93_ZPchr0004g38880 [Zizania palustris]
MDRVSHDDSVEIVMRSTSMAGDGPSGRRFGVLDSIGSVGARGMDSHNACSSGGRAMGGWNVMTKAVSSRT